MLPFMGLSVQLPMLLCWSFLTRTSLTRLYATHQEMVLVQCLCNTGTLLLMRGTPAEARYGTGDCDLLAVHNAMRAWRCYLEGAKGVTVVTDHCPLTFLKTQPNLSRRQARIAEFLANFDVKWQYRAGRSNVADPLSRIPEVLPEKPIGHAPGRPKVLVAHIQARCQQHLQLNALLTTTGDATQVSSDPEVQEEMQSTDSGAAVLYDLQADIQAGYTKDQWFEDAQNTAQLRRIGGSWYADAAIAVPNVADLRARILQGLHDSPFAGHPGVIRTVKSVQRWFWWPELRRDVEEYVKACAACQRNKPSNLATRSQLGSCDLCQYLRLAGIRLVLTSSRSCQKPGQAMMLLLCL